MIYSFAHYRERIGRQEIVGILVLDFQMGPEQVIAAFFTGMMVLLAGAKCSGGRRERGKSPFVAYCSCAELEAGTSHEVSSAAHKRGESLS